MGLSGGGASSERISRLRRLITGGLCSFLFLMRRFFVLGVSLRIYAQMGGFQFLFITTT